VAKKRKQKFTSGPKEGTRKDMGPKMGGLFGSMTAKKPEPDNKVKKQHAMRTARLTGKIL
jgi:hypothetical protein